MKGIDRASRYVEAMRHEKHKEYGQKWLTYKTQALADEPTKEETNAIGLARAEAIKAAINGLLNG